MNLSNEESLAYELAIHWHDKNYIPNLNGVDWARFAHLLTRNRMAVLAAPILKRANAQIPPDAQITLEGQVEKYTRDASLFRDSLAAYLQSSNSLGIETIVLKGLWLCEKIYRTPAMRPGGDIDILVRKEKVDACISVLEEQGVGEFWPNLLRDEYFTRHHLHQQRCTSDLKIWFEIHWALDHPYTLLTIDYDGIFARAKPATLVGAPIQEMALPDLVLSLAIHLVKHAVYLPSLVERADLPRIILADGMLMYYLDITEVIRQNQNIDWNLTIELARAWGAVDILGAVLQTCKNYFDAPVPPSVLDSLPVTGPWRITRRLMAHAAEQELAAYENRRASRFWKFVLSSNGAFILRPVRLLETASYFFPPADFLARRYHSMNFIYRLGHFSLAVRNTLRFGLDTFYFGMERYFRLRRLGKKASIFNTLETDL